MENGSRFVGPCDSVFVVCPATGRGGQPPEQSSAIPPEPANDREPVEEAKIYARGPEATEAGVTVAVAYVKADPRAVPTPDRERFYDVGYRSDLRNMIDHVIEIEGPIYFDVLIDRIARAHGFQRSGETVQKIIRAALGLLFGMQYGGSNLGSDAILMMERTRRRYRQRSVSLIRLSILSNVVANRGTSVRHSLQSLVVKAILLN
jgi:Protein of unknown function (DUF3320)